MRCSLMPQNITTGKANRCLLTAKGVFEYRLEQLNVKLKSLSVKKSAHQQQELQPEASGSGSTPLALNQMSALPKGNSLTALPALSLYSLAFLYRWSITIERRLAKPHSEGCRAGGKIEWNQWMEAGDFCLEGGCW